MLQSYFWMYCRVFCIWSTFQGSFFIYYHRCNIDFFDGMVARLLHVSSPIGKELDSLADIVTFGVAPATMIFTEFNSTNFLLFCNRIVWLLLLNGATYIAFCGIYFSCFFSPSTCKIQLRRASNHLIHWSSNTSKRPLFGRRC